MPPRKIKPPADRRLVLQLYNCGSDELIALFIEEIFVTYNSTIRIKIPEFEDPVFLHIDDERIVYQGKRYSDFSVSTIDEAREWLTNNNHPIVAFDPTQALE